MNMKKIKFIVLSLIFGNIFLVGCQKGDFIIISQPHPTLDPLPKIQNSKKDSEFKSLHHKQWHLKRMTRKSSVTNPVAKGESRLKVVILSTGIDYTHPELIGKFGLYNKDGEVLSRELITRGKADKPKVNQKDDDNNGLIDDLVGYDLIYRDGFAYDRQGMGTAMAGVISTNNLSITGLIENVTFIPVQYISDTGETSMALLAEALSTAAQYKPDVVLIQTLSVVSDRTLRSQNTHTQREVRVTAQLISAALTKLEKNSIVIISAGDGYRSFGLNKLENLMTHKNQFSKRKNTLVVTALASPTSDKSKTPLMYSSNKSQKYVDIAAPGEDIYTLKNGGGYTQESGTPLAAAMVASMALAYMQADICGTSTDNKRRNECVIKKLKSYKSMKSNPIVELSVKNGLYLGLDDFLKPSNSLTSTSKTK